MSVLSLDDPEMIRRFTQIYLQPKPVQVQTQAEPVDETKGENEKDIDASSEDQGEIFEDHVEPSVSSGHDQAESLDHADHQFPHTSENSVHGDQQSDHTALSDHADAFSYSSSVESVLPDQRSDRTALSDQIDGQSELSDEQSDRADEQSDHADSQSNHNFQQFTHPSEQFGHADEQSDHADTQSNHSYQQSTHASEKSDHADPPYHKDLDSEISSRIRHQATQTEPVNIYSPQITKMTHSKTQAGSLDSSANGSPSTTLSEAVASQSSDMKGKSAIDPVLLMSPKLSGILPPPSTPEAQPELTGSGISKLIISEVEVLKPLSMGESRHAPRTSGSYGRFQPFRMTSKSTESVTGSSGPSPSPGKPNDSGSGTSEMPSPLIKPVADDDDSSKISGLPDSTESSGCHTPSPSKTGSGANALATASPLTNDDERSPNGNPVDTDSINDRFAYDKSIDDKSDDGKSVDHESTNNESVNGNERESKSAENEFIDSISFDDTGVNDDSVYGKSAASKPVGAGAVRRGAHLPPHLKHLENSIHGSYHDQISEGKSTDQSDTAEAIKQDQSDSGTTNGRSGKRPNIEISTGNLPHPYEDGTVGSDLTPSSVIFHAVSPPPNAGLGNEDRTFQQFFREWGKPETRTTAAAKVRKVIIRVPDADPSLIASLVWGGMIDEIIIKAKSAEVIFASAEDCDKYYDIGRKGIPYKRKGSDKIQIAYVDKGTDVNVIGGLLQTYLDQGFTRCVRVTNVPAEFTLPQLQQKAGLKGRRLEGIEDGNLSTGLRYVVFRFCTIASAVQFKKALEREEEWEQCNIHYSPDPCTSSTRLDSLPGA